MPGPTLGSEVTEAKKTGSLLLEEFIVWGRVLVVWGGGAVGWEAACYLV